MTETLQKTENVAENIANKKMQLLEQVSAFELRDQLQIKDMRIQKLKEKNGKYKDLLQNCRKEINDNLSQLFRINDVYEAKNPTGYWQLESAKIGLKRVLTKIDEVLKCGNVL